jgi:hypothetical protein
MPTLFDSHEEFNEWFSKDIESHSQDKIARLDQSALLWDHALVCVCVRVRVRVCARVCVCVWTFGWLVMR